MSFRDWETIDDFTLRLTNLASLVTSLATLGEPIDESQFIKKFLRVVPPRFSQLALSIETLVDISELSLEDVTGRLKATEDHLESLEQPLSSESSSLLRSSGGRR